MSPAAPVSPVSTRRVVVVLAGAGTMVSLMQTLVIPLLPELPRLLHTSTANASWVITATLLTSAVATPLLGRLGDLYGRRRLMLTAVLSLTAGSLVCALGSTLLTMVMGRTLQGLGISVIPLGISIMRDVLPSERLGPAVALMSSSLGVGGALGLPLSATVAQHLGWHAPFWFAVGLGCVFAVLIIAVVPESPVRVRQRFDAPGAVGLSVGLVALLLPISKGGDWGWTSMPVLGLLTVSAVVLGSWAMWELRAAAPIVDLRSSARRPVLMTNLATVAVGFAMYSANLLGPQMLQLPTATGYGQGLSMLQAGLLMAPGGLAMMAFSPVAARMSQAFGPRSCLLLGTMVICCGNVLAQLLIGTAWGVLVFTIVNSAGVGFAYAAMPNLIMRSVPVSETAAANGLNSLARSLGTSTASTVIGLVLGQLTIQLGSVAVPSETGIRVCLAIGAAGALLATLVELAIPVRPAPQPPRAPVGSLEKITRPATG
ncbi:MFS transporter [Pseudofrankia asymbiotica]|uniref:MFS transporter n=1 Tax=Pseudofrankia asymbiotica TaxID=1834516 RepID=A0A1V2IHM0_9ACTN|nr:MFS transporter [Pseudofrankia asymbiotica]